jgi:hypothetical protein|tara:strand:- start:9761 stop:10015 length:255 start_codon:yes stop_codon:yes gene_type:complete
MKILKYFLAKILIPKKLEGKLDQNIADKFNHCSAIIRMKGGIKLDWYKLRGIEVVKCHRCLVVLRRGPKKKGEYCVKCMNEGYQ